MQGALLMLVLALRGGGRAIRMSDTELEARRAFADGELGRDHPGKHGVEHERVSRDPADKLAPKPEPSSSPCCHRTPLACMRIMARQTGHSPENYRLKNWSAAERCACFLILSASSRAISSFSNTRAHRVL